MSIYDKASLVLIPSGTKTSKVFSQKPVNGDGDFTFSRSTAATRVNADGNIEKETQNLFTYSNTFSNSSWLKADTSVTGGQAGYDGTNDAWLITKVAAAYRAIDHDVNNSGVYTFSVYAKANTLDKIYLRNQTLSQGAFFDLTNGTTYGNSGVFSSIVSVGGGWYRCAITFNGASTRLAIYIALDVATAGSVYIQDAQVEQGLVARDYIETTTAAVEGGITDNVPRLDYTDSSCPALLLEPQRTNTWTYSEHLNSSAFGKTRCTIEDNSTTSPEGVVNASKMTSTDSAESYIQDNVTTTGTKFTWSFFAKKGDLDYAHGLVWDLSANGCRQWFNLSTGAVGGTTTFGSGYSIDSATIEDYGNGWYRCAMVVNSTAGTQGCRVNISSADTTITSAVNSYGYFYGLQAEDASYATSYIPTYGTSVTRNADDCSVTGVSDLIGQTEGTIFFEWSKDVLNFGSAYSYFQVGVYPNYIGMYIQASNCVCEVINAGVVQASITKSSVSIGTHKAAVAYANNDIAFYFDGVQVGTDSSATIPATSQVNLNSNNGIAEKINQTLVFKTRLSNEELAALTTI